MSKRYIQVSKTVYLTIAILKIVLIVKFALAVYCPPGSYEVGNRTCHECPAGTYQPNDGSTKCLQCPYRVSYTEPGALRESQCIDICEYNSVFFQSHSLSTKAGIAANVT